MSYFTAVIAGDGRAWRARDVDVEDADSLDDLAETMRGVAHGTHPVITVIEREDEWFALVRVDGDEDARVFVSDLVAAERGPYAELLAPAADVDVAVDDPVEAVAAPAEAADGEEPVAADGEEAEPESEAGGVGDLHDLLDEADDDGVLPDADVPDDDPGAEVEDLDEPEPPPVRPWAGDPTLLDDLGVDRKQLCALSEDHTDDPAAALAEIGELVGFADLIEALR